MKHAFRAGVSQPTVSRARQKFLRRDLLRYEVVPDLAKLGFEIIAFTTVEPSEDVKGDSRVVLEGILKMFVISVHKNFTDYANFASRYEVHSSFLVPTSRKPMKPLSFKDIPF